MEMKKDQPIPVQLTEATAQDIPALGRILYQAFRDFQMRHGFPPDFANEQAAVHVMGLLVQTGHFQTVVARAGGRAIGSNFLSLFGDVGGVGPITVDSARQGAGVGRALMQAILDHAHRRGLTRIRLMQDAHNLASFSLYCSLGFDWKETCAFMQINSFGGGDQTVGESTPSDLPEIADLSLRLNKVDRSREIAFALENGAPPLLRRRDRRLVGYLSPGMLGHAAAESADDLLALIAEMSWRQPQEFSRIFCPLNHAELYRTLLKNGCRAIRMMNLMAIGPYEPPHGVCLPSIYF
ncbi:MAG TPA: GNAT family N-acetyltransferase [Tepidisphaeraceae bacterium]